MKKHLSLILAMCMILSMAFTIFTNAEEEVSGGFTIAPMAAEESEGATAEYSEDVVKAAQHALDYIEVENVIGKHEYYHSALNHMGEFLDIWVNEDPWMETMSWTNNNQKMVGAYNVWGFMVPDLVSNISNSLGSAMNNDNQGIIEESEEWYGTGMFWYHMLMSPVIVVADDGQTARACFQSFGTVTGPMGDLCAQWTCESYGFDCAKMSTGEWRIWHLHTYVYFYVDTTSTWAYTGSSSSTPSGVDAALLPTGATLTNSDTSEGESPEGEAPAENTQGAGEDQVVNGIRLGDLDLSEYTFDDLVAMGFDMTPPGGDMTPPDGNEAPVEEAAVEETAVEEVQAAPEGESPEGESPEGESPEGESLEGEAPADMTPPGGAPGGGGGYSQGDYEVIRGEYFTNYSIYKTPESCPIPYPYDTWATVEANGDSY